MERPTTEQIVAALRCLDTNMPCGGCYYRNTTCRKGALEKDAADLIEAQAARIRELEDSARVAHSHWLVEPVVIGVFDGEKLTCFNPKCRRYYGTVTYGERPDYCPHCGARMDGGAV